MTDPNNIWSTTAIENLKLRKFKNWEIYSEEAYATKHATYARGLRSNETITPTTAKIEYSQTESANIKHRATILDWYEFTF